MPRTYLEIAREHGLIPAMLSDDIRRMADARRLPADDAALAARLRGLGYSSGEVDARLAMAGRVAA